MGLQVVQMCVEGLVVVVFSHRLQEPQELLVPVAVQQGQLVAAVEPLVVVQQVLLLLVLQQALVPLTPVQVLVLLAQVLLQQAQEDLQVLQVLKVLFYTY
jgi:hypothetical protein